jgi:hypothetical protein
MDGTGDHHVEQDKPDSERQIPLVFLILKKKRHESGRETILGRGRG